MGENNGGRGNLNITTNHMVWVRKLNDTLKCCQYIVHPDKTHLITLIQIWNLHSKLQCFFFNSLKITSIFPTYITFKSMPFRQYWIYCGQVSFYMMDIESTKCSKQYPRAINCINVWVSSKYVSIAQTLCEHHFFVLRQPSWILPLSPAGNFWQF